MLRFLHEVAKTDLSGSYEPRILEACRKSPLVDGRYRGVCASLSKDCSWRASVKVQRALAQALPDPVWVTTHKLPPEGNTTLEASPLNA